MSEIKLFMLTSLCKHNKGMPVDELINFIANVTSVRRAKVAIEQLQAAGQVELWESYIKITKRGKQNMSEVPD